ncbi:hypothetical protein B484DRAFT_442222 [Ochromonadaceae sp. CCMP2298]|nr:hypothetical protein B484DRAFT_442222 [Ochromonadaceae sp. CCMP2298]
MAEAAAAAAEVTAAAPAAADFVCQICCVGGFTSRNKLFKHVRVCSTGPTAQSQTKSIEVAGDDDSTLYLYVVGGRLRGRTLRSVERFCFASNKWENCPLMMEGRGSHGAAGVGSVLYTIGGGGFHSNLSSCEAYDDLGAGGVGRKWRTVAGLGVSRHALAVAGTGDADDAIYAVGGWVDGTVCTGAVERYTPSTDRWESLAPLLLPRRLHALAAFPAQETVGAEAGTAAGQRSRDRLFVFGGNCDDPHWHTGSAEEYSPAENTWKALPPMPGPGGGAAAVTVLPFVFVFRHGKHVLRFDPATRAYLRLSDLPLPDWHCFGAVALPGSSQVCVHGGISAGSWSRAAFLYDAATDAWSRMPDMTQARRRCGSAVLRQPRTEPVALALAEGAEEKEDEGVEAEGAQEAEEKEQEATGAAPIAAKKQKL